MFRITLWSIFFILLSGCASFSNHSQTLRTPANLPVEGPFFSSYGIAELTLKGNFQEFIDQLNKTLITDGESAAKALILKAELSYFDQKLKRVVRLNLALKARGHTSLNPEECPFPKMEARVLNLSDTVGSSFAGISKFKIGTHCGELPESERTPKGRLANQISPVREAFVYQVLDLLGVPAQKARPVRIDYQDSGNSTTIQRYAFFLEDLGQFSKRIGGKVVKYRSASEEGAEDEESPTSASDHPVFKNAQDENADLDALVGVFFAQTLVNNYDWGVRISNNEFAFSSLANVKVIAQPSGKKIIIPQDFDLATTVSGRVENSPNYPPDAAYSENPSPLFNYDVMNLGRARQMFSSSALAFWINRFTQKREPIMQALQQSSLDEKGKIAFAQHVDVFFPALDHILKSSVVSKTTKYYLDAQLKNDCDGEEVSVGTPVRKNAVTGAVRLLDMRYEMTCANRDVWLPEGTISHP